MLYGLDIGGTKIELSAFDQGDHVLTERIATPTHCYHSFKNSIRTLVNDADKILKTRGSVGIGIPGVINPNSLKAFCANIPCTHNRDLVADLEFTLDRPISIENDANCFTLSEALGGAGNNFETVLGIILGTGCGGGFYARGSLLKGCNNMVGEWGHCPLPYNIFDIAGSDFPIEECGCGRMGCLESYLSARGMENLHKHYCSENLRASDIVTAFQQKDAKAIKTVEVYCELLASSLASLIKILDPHVIVLGGGLSNFDDLYRLLPKYLNKYCLPQTGIPKIRKAIYGDTSGVRGAALLNA